jgi:uncharacterized protein (DUF2336 family)
MSVQSSNASKLSSLQGRASELLALARDPSPAARTALVSGLYDLSHKSPDVSAGERDSAVDLVLEIAKSAAASVRQQLAEQLANDPEAPKALVLALAHDEISVAFPLLIESSVLDDADLLEILRTSPPEYQLATLQRQSVSPAVAEAVVATRDLVGMQWLVENPGASIPASAMAEIVTASRAEPKLQTTLIDRPDLPADLAAKMCDFVSDDLRKKLVDQHHVKPPAPGKARAAAPSDPAGDAQRAMQKIPVGQITSELLLKTIRAEKTAEFEALLARFSGISLDAVRHILESTTGDALAVLLKARGVDKSAFSTIFVLNRKVRDASTANSKALWRVNDTFDKLSVEDAKQRLAALQQAHPQDPES